MDNYFNVLNAFIDKKDSYYSIHQIGKSLGAEECGGIRPGFPRSVEHCSIFILLDRPKKTSMSGSGGT